MNQKINYTKLGKSNLMVPEICFGATALGNMPDTYGYEVNEISTLTQIPKLCPDEYLGQMSTIIFPVNDHKGLKETLYDTYNIEIPTYTKDGHTAFRISLQGYNSNADVETLINALKALL